MMESDAIDKIVELSSAKSAHDQISRETENSVVAVHNNFQLKDIEKYLPEKRRFQAHLRTNEIQSFVVYADDMARQVSTVSASVGQHPDEEQSSQVSDPVPVFVDPDEMSAQAVFDLGSVTVPLHADNKATVTLTKTAEYREFCRRNGESATQRTFAEWLEDWRDFITAYNSEGEVLPFAAVIAAVRNYEVSEKNEAGSEEKNFGTRKTALSEVNAKNADRLPAFIDFACKPYKELSERKLSMRVAIRNGSDPQFTVRAVQFETVQEDIATEFVDLLQDRLGGGGGLFRVLIGSI
jgi:uncharacterized protein YfdQ (DUF2303 family)